ncbi:hypothetical protein [Candidatus Pelagibacter communis]|uniref:hypothetical protein n=1 Tax=Pelagibacter ubique TaxID=198252 RepID=UPI00094CF54C|nr:hypothetical protein [Candidatus Pelagibacter ubique]
MNKFINKTYQQYRLIKINKRASDFAVGFSEYYDAVINTKTDQKVHLPFNEKEQEIIVGEFEVLKLKTGTGPSGEIIIKEPEKELTEDIFFNFINLSDDKGKISSFDIYSFANRYGLLVNQPFNIKLFKEKYHFETLSFWRYEIALMHSLIKTYSNYQNENIEELKKIFIKDKKNFLEFVYLDNTYSKFEENNLKSNIKLNIDLHDMISPSGNFLFEEIYEQLVVRVFYQILNERLRQTSHTIVTEVEEPGKFQNRNQRWINFKTENKDLLNFIWSSFASFIQKKGKINICKNNRCNKYFSSQKFTRAKFHSNQCRAAYARDAKMWELAQIKLIKDDNLLIIDERVTGIGKLRTFDALIVNEKNDKVLAMVEFSFSDIDHKSMKWNYMKKKISKNLNDLYKINKVNHAFLINKNGKLFEWDIKKKIYGNEVKKLPETKNLNQSDLTIDKTIRQLIDFNKK